MEDEVLGKLLKAVPFEFHASFKSQADEAIQEVWERATRHRYTRQQFGMCLYPELERALLLAANDAGLKSSRQVTQPPGGSFAHVVADGFVIGRHSGAWPMSLPRRSGFRERLAVLNSPIDPQPQLFGEPQIQSSAYYFSFLTVPDYRTGSGCAALALGAYTSDFQRWARYWTFEELKMAYVPEEVVSDEAAPVEVPDAARPQLKKPGSLNNG
tara:strand:- start:2655 stop:3293 length:639 start_codon:yes stop_codon:yes gene_type:complete